MRWMIFALVVAVVGCGGSPQVRHYGEAYPPTAPSAVEVLYSFPDDRDYVKIGAMDVRRYKPGFSDPSVHDAAEKLQEAGAALGAHAVVVVNSHSTGERFIQVSAEAIRWQEDGE